ncbi:hypothetical protein JF546_08185 [Nitratireductor aquimarinus]|uniref:hypothetical protein n=1 Tax=Alphaproteobacteria TaxID=28211 RepID=UPI0019D376C4|nr:MULTISPECIES: hypothetical protein [Alphaproteobacteria]MBY6023680.1 hypothetical protein [Nitratireductor sp. DP7N14-4]MBN7758630.1 hypothetical protein [Nitratireductor aquimarinus]MBN7763581.1 hypothetical protein [Nitratireductor aquibiodomus]MBN7774692.1 hypothetical protein [Nitratireductor pacificus]MBN7779553.1 hypothetical protein [Nitratireductor pacificus]
MMAKFVAAIVVLATVTPAAAQSMTPMRGEIRSFSDSFAVRVRPHNPYRHRIEVAVRVYDEDFRPIAAKVVPSKMMLGSDVSRPVLVSVDFGESRTRRVRICTESIPFPDQKTRIRAQICGRFIAYRAN